MIATILSYLFPRTIAAIRVKAYRAGYQTAANTYIDLVRSFKKEETK